MELHLPQFSSLIRTLHRIYGFHRQPLDWLESTANPVWESLYAKGWPWRRIRSFRWFPLLLIVALLAYRYPHQLTAFVNQTWTTSLRYVGGEKMRDLETLGNLLGFKHTDFTMYASAQIVADIISAIILFVVGTILYFLFYGKFRQGLSLPTHEIKVFTHQDSTTDQIGVTTYYVTISNTQGEEPAPNCRAKITFKGLTWRDIVDNPRVTPKYSRQSDEIKSTNYFKTTDLTFTLPWRNGAYTETILSGERTLLPVLKLVPERDGIPEHFEVPLLVEVPSMRTVVMGVPVYRVDVGVCLKPLYEYGEIRIIPEEGRFHSAKFAVNHRGKRWVFET